MNPYQKIIYKALCHIRNEQLSDGSFLSLTTCDPNNFSNSLSYKTTFFTANILLCLSPTSNDTNDIYQKGIGYLLQQKSYHWSFNYFAKNDGINVDTQNYPDDMDDTFAALAAIVRYDPDILDGKALAAIIKLLLFCEIKAGGPLKTWLIPNDVAIMGNQPDIIVNSTVGYFLSLIEVIMPNIVLFITESIKQSQLSSRYYPGICQTFYFISRFYKNSRLLLPLLRAHVEKTSYSYTLLEYAMVITSFINLDAAHEIAPNFIAKFIADIETAGFKPYPFCIDPSRNNKKYYAGSSALTAAFCYEALVNYYAATSITQSLIVPLHNSAIHQLAREQCNELDDDLKIIALSHIDMTTDEKITLLAYEFQESIRKNKNHISDSLTEKLALANLYGWMAYTIYDHVIDGEEDASAIPCANLFLRKFIAIYNFLDKDIPGASDLADNILTIIDNAHAWEEKNCRYSLPVANMCKLPLPVFASYQNLTDRSIGHALGPLVAMLSLGYSRDSQEYVDTKLFFHHYLIARQLNDDAHDWKEDLTRGTINSVATMVIQEFQKVRRAENISIDLFTALPEMENIFWSKIISKTAELILFHLQTAKTVKRKIGLLANGNFMDDAIEEFEKIARKTLQEHATTLDFLKYYGANANTGDIS